MLHNGYTYNVGDPLGKRVTRVCAFLFCSSENHNFVQAITLFNNLVHVSDAISGTSVSSSHIPVREICPCWNDSG